MIADYVKIKIRPFRYGNKRFKSVLSDFWDKILKSDRFGMEIWKGLV